jgi:hypothetical protein
MEFWSVHATAAQCGILNWSIVALRIKRSKREELNITHKKRKEKNRVKRKGRCVVVIVLCQTRSRIHLSI